MIYKAHLGESVMTVQLLIIHRFTFFPKKV